MILHTFATEGKLSSQLTRGLRLFAAGPLNSLCALVIFVNLNQTDEIDSHEYECLILDFVK